LRPIEHALQFDEALGIVLEAAEPVRETERVGLRDADGRVAAADVVAELDVPPFDRAAMDGYAVLASDTQGASAASPRALHCVERVFTGQLPHRQITAGECIEIATGAPVPHGADAVVMFEETRREPGELVQVLAPVRSRQNIGARGSDVAAGQVVIRKDQVLSPAGIGAIATVGRTDVHVYRRPAIAILSTGNEIATQGNPLGPGQVYDVNRFTLSAVVNRHGGIAAVLPIALDDIGDLSAALDVTLGHDVIVFSGGSSVGDRDLVLDVVRQRGQIYFHGIAVKPGKPTAFGRIGAAAVFGMPGNPTSCLSNAYMLLVPFIRKMARLPPWTPITRQLPLARRVISTPGRHQFYTVRVVDERAEPAFKTSGDITSMAHADGYIEIPAQTGAIEAGTLVTVKYF
jgi:molybdenum cofactor synthesis domain-containing protein